MAKVVSLNINLLQLQSGMILKLWSQGSISHWKWYHFVYWILFYWYHIK